MNIMKHALRKAEVITDNDLERVERQERIEREKERKRRQRKKARAEYAKRARVKKICQRWVDMRWPDETKETREAITKKAYESLTERDIEKYSFKEITKKVYESLTERDIEKYSFKEITHVEDTLDSIKNQRAPSKSQAT